MRKRIVGKCLDIHPALKGSSELHRRCNVHSTIDRIGMLVPLHSSEGGAVGPKKENSKPSLIAWIEVFKHLPKNVDRFAALRDHKSGPPLFTRL